MPIPPNSVTNSVITITAMSTNAADSLTSRIGLTCKRGLSVVFFVDLFYLKFPDFPLSSIIRFELIYIQINYHHGGGINGRRIPLDGPSEILCSFWGAENWI